MERDPGLPTHTVYRPQDLSRLKGQKLPILTWGNGACANAGDSFKNFLTEIASHGFLAIAIGPISTATPKPPTRSPAAERNGPNGPASMSSQLPIDRTAMFLMGHSMGSGGTWYLGAKYSNYWAAMAPMSGPFVEQSIYPWERIRNMPLFMTEGTGATPSLAGSRAMQQWMKANSFKLECMEVDANHPGMVPLVLTAIFDFLDRVRKK